MGRNIALCALALAVALGAAVPALPQAADAPCRLCPPKPGDQQQKPSTPVTLAVEASLDFDRLILDQLGSGSAGLDPAGGRSVSGSVSAIGARAMVGQVVIHGEPGRIVRVDLPTSIELHGLSGGVLRLESIRSDLPPMPRLDSAGRLSFRFGGVVQVTGELDGEFRGDVPIGVDYF